MSTTVINVSLIFLNVPQIKIRRYLRACFGMYSPSVSVLLCKSEREVALDLLGGCRSTNKVALHLDLTQLVIYTNRTAPKLRGAHRGLRHQHNKGGGDFQAIFLFLGGEQTRILHKLNV